MQRRKYQYPCFRRRATYYGSVLAGSGFTPTAGMPVIAWVDGNLCGQSETLEVESQVVYSVNVFADGVGSSAGCGVPERLVTFQVSSQVMVPTAVWNNSRLRELPLIPDSQRRVYLPLILKN